MKKFLLFIGFSFAVTFLFAQTQSFTCGDSLLDIRDGQTYATILIGTQCWMARNMNIGTEVPSYKEQTDNGIIEKYCYDNSTVNCNEYGGLYQWNEMMEYVAIEGAQGICSNGWHIPTHKEWTILINYLGGQDKAGGKMMEADVVHWKSPNTKATNESGFTALPGSASHTDGSYSLLGNLGIFWSSSSYYDTGSEEMVQLQNNFASVDQYGFSQGNGASIRCLKD